MVATTWRETSIRPRSLDWISVLGGFPVRGGLAFVFESIRVLLCDADFAPIIRDDSGDIEANKHHGTTLPDLHKARVTISGRLQTAMVCTRCIRTQAKSV